MSGMPPETFAPAPVPPIPWEQPGYPVMKALFETIGLFFTRPREAFRRMPITPNIGRPIAYLILLGWVAIAAEQVYSVVLQSILPMNDMFGMKMQEMGMAGGAVRAVVVVILAPVLLLVFLFVWSGIVHVFLLLVGGANSGFLTTVRVLCYAGTSHLWGLLPVCGGLIGAVWGIVLQILGIAEAHRTTTGKAALAVLLPLLLCCVCVGIVFALMGATILALLRGGSQ
jgi:hypothetical protein